MQNETQITKTTDQSSASVAPLPQSRHSIERWAMLIVVYAVMAVAPWLVRTLQVGGDKTGVSVFFSTLYALVLILPLSAAGLIGLVITTIVFSTRQYVSKMGRFLALSGMFITILVVIFLFISAL